MLGVLKKILSRLPESARARLYRVYRPRLGYLMFPRTTPISRSYWTDRGGTIDRYFIESFLKENADLVHGDCLEIRSPDYIHRFGHDVTRADVLDIDRANARATIYGDLQRLEGVADNSFDCVIVTQTLQYIPDLDAAVKEILRITKPGGAALLTVPSLQKRDLEGYQEYWRFTAIGTAHLFRKYFPPANVEVKTWGNVLSGMAFWIGLAQEELKPTQLDKHDPMYPCTISVRAIKPRAA